MRVIDADELYRVKFHGYPDIEITPSDVNAEAYKRGWNDAIDAVAECAPAFEVVRCKDCKYWTDKNSGYCDVWGEYISNEEFFCAYGERREDDGSD